MYGEYIPKSWRHDGRGDLTGLLHSGVHFFDQGKGHSMIR